MKLLACAAALSLAVCTSSAFAQAPMGHAGGTMSDEELIKLALSAAPEAVTKDATVITVGSDGKTRTLRQGSGQWTCMPGHTDRADPDPMCGDKNAMEWASAWMAHKDPPSNKVGFMYMLRGDGEQYGPIFNERRARQQLDQDRSHVMIVGSGAKMLDGYPREAKADPTKPYVMWPGTVYEHLMLPVR